MVNTFMYQH